MKSAESRKPRRVSHGQTTPKKKEALRFVTLFSVCSVHSVLSVLSLFAFFSVGGFHFHSPWSVNPAQKCGACHRVSFHIETCASRRAAAGLNPWRNSAS